MKKSMVFTMFLFLSICLYSDEISKESKDLIFSIKGNYFSSNYKNSSQEENYFKSDDSNISCEPSINMISKNPRSTSHLYLNSKGKYIKSKAKCTVYAFNYESKQKENMLIYDGDVEMIRTGLNLGYKRLIHNQKSIINFLNIDGKFDHYKSEYSANSFLNSKLRMTFITIDFGYVFKPIENSDMYFASTRKSDITEYYLYNKQANFESEFYFTPHIENNIFNNSFYKNYDYGEPYKTEEKYTHQSFGLNLETRTIYRKKNLITGLRFSVIYGILFKDFWNYDDIPSELRGNIEIFANLLLDKFILTSRINGKNENVFLHGISFTRINYSFFNELTFQLNKTFFISLNYNFNGKKFNNCNSSILFVTEMDQIPEKLFSEHLFNSNIGLSVKLIF